MAYAMNLGRTALQRDRVRVQGGPLQRDSGVLAPRALTAAPCRWEVPFTAPLALR